MNRKTRKLHVAVQKYLLDKYPELTRDDVAVMGYCVTAQLHGTVRSEQMYGRMTPKEES